eukprot:g4098.t1
MPKKNKKNKKAGAKKSGGGADSLQMDRMMEALASMGAADDDTTAAALAEMSAKETVEDDIGRIFCKLHRRDVCHECCMDFRACNRFAEERAGQRKTRTELEDLAEQKVQLQNGLAHMRNMGSPPEMAGNIKFHETELSIVEGKIAAALAGGGGADELHSGAQAERDKYAAQEAEKNAVLQQWARNNPGKTRMRLGGAEHQRLFDQFAASAPTVPNARAPEKHTCMPKGSVERTQKGL